MPIGDADTGLESRKKGEDILILAPAMAAAAKQPQAPACMLWSHQHFWQLLVRGVALALCEQ